MQKDSFNKILLGNRLLEGVLFFVVSEELA
jgi:hypothetical protein